MNNNENYDNDNEKENDDTLNENENVIVNDIDDVDCIDSNFKEDCKAIVTEHDYIELIELNHLLVKQNSDDQGNYPLHKFCMSKHTYSEAIVIKLFEIYPAAARIVNNKGLYPFEIACINKQSENVLMKLLEYTPTLVSESPGSHYLECLSGYYLHVACETGKSEVVIRKLIELNPMLLQKQDSIGRYPIHCALERGQSNDLIMHLIDSDPFAMQRQTGSGQKSPLHLVCSSRNIVLAGYMIQRSGTSINIKDSDGATPLHMACNYSQHELIIEWNQDNNLNNYSYEKMAEQLLQHPDIDVNCRDNSGETPLHKAIIGRNCSHRQLLNHPFINVNCTDNIGQTPLHKATNAHDFTGFRELLSHPFILINEKDHNNRNSLDLIKQSIQNLEMWDGPSGSLEGFFNRNKLQECEKIVRLIDDFKVYQRCVAYHYHLRNLLD